MTDSRSGGTDREEDGTLSDRSSSASDETISTSSTTIASSENGGSSEGEWRFAVEDESFSELPLEESWRDLQARRDKIYRPEKHLTWTRKGLHLARKKVPILSWLPEYRKGWLEKVKGDVGAGLTVGIMLIPQGMAYAVVAGLPPIYGLYASTVPLLVYAVLGTSRQLAVGPVALVSLLVNEAITGGSDPLSPRIDTGSATQNEIDAYVGYALGMSLLVGLIQFAMGVVRGGYIVNFLSHPVLSGFTSAAALLIGLSQAKYAFGTKPEKGDNFFDGLANLVSSLDETNGWELLFCGVSMFVLLLMKYGKQKKWRYYPKYLMYVPAPLVVVSAGIIIMALIDNNGAQIKIVGDIPEGLPPLSTPKINSAFFGKAIVPALMVAIVGFMESIAVAKKYAEQERYEVDPSQELIALGSANLVGSILSAYPVTGGFSRTPVNAQGGAKTPIASVLSVFVVVVALLFLNNVLKFLPYSVLAAIIFVAVVGLIDTDEVQHLWRVNKLDWGMWIAAFVLTLSVGIELGIILSIGLSILLVVQRISQPHRAVLGRLPGTTVFRNARRFPSAIVYRGITVLRFDANIFFANSENFKSTVRKIVWQNRADLGLPAQPTEEQEASHEQGDPLTDTDAEIELPSMDSSENAHQHQLDIDHASSRAVGRLRFLILDMSATYSLDSTAVHAFASILEFLKPYDVKIVLSSVNGPVRDMLKKTGLMDEIRSTHIFWEVNPAVEACVDAVERKLSDLPRRPKRPGAQDTIRAFEEDTERIPRSWLLRQTRRVPFLRD